MMDKLLLESIQVNVQQMQQELSDIRQRLDTLQTPLWKRIWFRIDGWPGQTNLNADKRQWRPWHGGN